MHVRLYVFVYVCVWVCVCVYVCVCVKEREGGNPCEQLDDSCCFTSN